MIEIKNQQFYALVYDINLRRVTIGSIECWVILMSFNFYIIYW